MRYQSAQIKVFSLLRSLESDINEFLRLHKDNIIDIQMRDDHLLIVYKED